MRGMFRGSRQIPKPIGHSMAWVEHRHSFVRSAGVLVIGLLWLLVFPTALAGQTIFFVGTDSAGTARSRTHLVAEFFGLKVTTLNVNEAVQQARRQSPLGVFVVDAQVFEVPSARKKILSSELFGRYPVLVAEYAGQDLGSFAPKRGGDPRDVESASSQAMLQVLPDESYAFELSGVRIPLWGWEVRHAPDGDRFLWMVSLEGGGGVTGRFANDKQSTKGVYVGARIEGAPGDSIVATYTHRNAVPLLSYLMFLKIELGDACMHGPADFANLTIDDPMLLQPYGFLDYFKLSTHMEDADFHTTIAFLPWNYDRFEMRIVALFRGFPSRLSLAVHGNDHVHREFGTGENPGPLETGYKLAQGKVRMRRFSELAGLPWDTVMVFPHQIGPVHALRGLKENGYLATFNSRNVPADTFPSGPRSDALRAVTLAYGGFASVKRFPAHYEPTAEDSARIAIDLFLDNPVLRYTHQAFFSESAGAFDKMARVVNGLQPDIRWASLGTIARHLYGMQLQSGAYAKITMYSDEITVRNTRTSSVVYDIWKPETFTPPITKILLDNSQAMTYGTEDGVVRMLLGLAPGEQRTIRVVREEPPKVNLPYQRHGLRKKAVRAAAEVRDRVLPSLPVLRAFAGSYYGDDGRGNERTKATYLLVGSVAGGLAFMGIGFAVYRKRKKNAKK